MLITRQIWGPRLIAAVGGLCLLLGTTSARAASLAGTIWSLSGGGVASGGHRFAQDRHLRMRAGGSGILGGSSCCEDFSLAFPSNEAASLRHKGYEIATGSTRIHGSTVDLIPDQASLGVLAWWAENEIEFFWNGGPFDLALNLRVERITAHSLRLQLPSPRAGERGTLRLAFKFAGTVLNVQNVRRFGPGPAHGSVTFVGSGSPVASEEEDTGPSPYPPIVACDAETGIESAARAWPHPDYCR